MTTQAVHPDAIRVAIATTQGPAVVTSLTALGGQFGTIGIRSMINLDGGGAEAEILGPALVPNSYHDFVRLETGVIERLFGRAPFIMDVSRRIDAGESWQAGVLLAHAAYARARLATRDRRDGVFGVAAWATGIVDPHDFSLKKITHLREKLACSVEHFAESRKCGARVIAFIPNENAKDAEQIDEELQDKLRAAAVELVAVTTAGEMFERLGLRGTEESSPYRGLLRFEPSDRAFFFGRSQAVKQAIDQLVQGFHDCHPFLLIRGSSGVGKSSFVRAGILGNIELLQDYGAWTTAIVDLQDTGDEPPLSALADTLIKALPDLVRNGYDATALARLDPTAFAASVAAALPYHPEAAIPHRLLVLIDQLERVFRNESAETLSNGSDWNNARDRFARTLAALVTSGVAWVIATMLTDYLPAIDDCPELLALARGRDFVLRAPLREELEEMIVEPMKLWGLRLGADSAGRNLKEILLDDAVAGPGSLPLLEYTLDELVRQLERSEPGCRMLSYEAHQKLGGLTGAIGRRIDESLETLGGMELHRPGIEALICNLARIDRRSTARLARTAPLADLAAASIDPRLIQLMAQLRLIIPDRATVRVAHEALLTKWSVADQILAEAGDDLLLRDALEPQADRWHDASGPTRENYLLRSEGQLTDATALLRRRRWALSAKLIAFIETSYEDYQRWIRNEVARLAADEQRSLGHIRAGEFKEAEQVLAGIVDFLEQHRAADLRERAAEFRAYLERIHRLAGFFQAAREADTLAGEEEFDKAVPKCQEALQHLRINDKNWLDSLPTQDLNEDQVRDLEQEAYRTLLLFSGLQLVPGIRALRPDVAPAPVAARKRRVNLISLTQPLLPYLVSALGPLLLRVLAKRGGLGSFRLPARLDREKALAEFEKTREALAKIGELEERFALQCEHARGSSRTSAFVHRLVDFFCELASPPKGESIDYRRWLLGGWEGPPPKPINAADYFFIGLLNYFIAKRKEAWIPKALTLVHGQFPDIDAKDAIRVADRLLRVAVMLEPRNFWGHWLLGRNLLEARDYAGAQLAFNAAISLRPVYARGYEQRALAIANQAANAKAEDYGLHDWAMEDSKSARRFAAHANGDPSIFWPRGELFDVFGDTAEAFHSYGRWLELEQDIPSLIARADGLSKLERKTTRLLRGRLSNAAADRTLRADAFAVRAHVRVIRNIYQSALDDAEAALRLTPHQMHALTAKGMTLLRLGQPESALEPLELAIGIAPADEPNYRGLLERARAREKIAADAAALKAWRELAEASKRSTGDRCPAWMLDEAKHAEARLTAASPPAK